MDKKLWFTLAAITVGCAGFWGCDDSSSGSGAGGSANAKMCGGVFCPVDACVGDNCTISGDELKTALADACSDKKTCHTQKDCNGTSDSCTYECAKANNNCNWAVCKGMGDCGGVAEGCDPETLMRDDPYGDYDKDGISNTIEYNSKLGLDPCNADTDGDTIPDGDEDLNLNGIYEAELGETNPVDPNSKPDASAIELSKAVCKAQDMSKGRTDKMKIFHVAAPRAIAETGVISDSLSAKFNRDAENASAVVYDDPAGVAMFFASVSDGYVGTSGKMLLKEAQKNPDSGIESYTESSNFNSSIPLSTWKANGYKGADNPKAYQVVPNHEVARFVYLVKLNSETTLEAFRDAVANVVDVESTDTVKSDGVTKCGETGEVLLYLTRSTYEDDNGKMVEVFSGAAACANTADKDIKVKNRMADIASGTHVAPKGLGDVALGYVGYKDFQCQIEDYGKSSATVDFIWVIDNSGSMQDEQENLSQTVDAFIANLEAAGIDYRVGVTSTDAFLLDEWDDKYEERDKNIWSGSIRPNLNNSIYSASKLQGLYYGYTGLRINSTNASNLDDMMNRCMMTKAYAEKTSKKTDINIFRYLVTESPACVGKSNKNLCGRGHEDGLKSGLTVLQRLSLEAGEPYETLKSNFDAEKSAENIEKLKKSNWVYGRTSDQAPAYGSSLPCLDGKDANNETGKASCAKAYESCTLRDNALRYIIWVSDEESRQFKEPVEGTEIVSLKGTDLIGCLTGYKLVAEDANEDGIDLSKFTFNMANGPYTQGMECNAALKDELATSGIDEETPLAEIKENAPNYYNMLMYYIKEYRQFAGEMGIAGFAIVGDKGKDDDKGGACEVLKNESSATTGANYGLSYIHMAKYLSQLTDDGKNDGKGGGYASICSDKYNETVEAIFADVSGRLSKHGLEGYPIASTIRVAIVQDGGKALELERGKQWSYDASQNTITFRYSANENDKIAISYVIWKTTEG